MAGSNENPKIGLSDVIIAELLNDDGSAAPTYGEIIPLKGAVQASVNPNSTVETDYADNTVFFVTGNRANTEMTLELTNVAPATIAKMLGQAYQNGVIQEKALDQAPYFALGFKVWIGGTDEAGNKIFEYFWYYKGKFSVPESGGTTKKDSLEFQHVSMTAQFSPTQYKPDGNSGVFCNHVRTDNPDAPASLLAGWFNAPMVDINADLGSVTVAIAQGSTASKITITGSKSGGGDMVWSAPTVKASNIIVTSSGTVVPGTFSVDDNVITFTSEDAMEGDIVVTVTDGLKDINGVGVSPTSEVVTIS